MVLVVYPQFMISIWRKIPVVKWNPTINQSVMTRSDQPEPPAAAIVRQNGLSSASSRASVADTPMSRQIWWTQVVDGRPQVRLHSCEGRSPSLVLAQIRRIEFAGASLRSLATSVDSKCSSTAHLQDPSVRPFHRCADQPSLAASTWTNQFQDCRPDLPITQRQCTKLPLVLFH